MCLTRDEEWESGQVTTGPAIEKTTTRRKKEANGSRTWVEETDLSDEKRRLLGSTRAWNVQKGGIVSRQTDSNGREKWPKSHRPHSNSFYQKNLPSSFSLSLRQIEKTTTWLQCSLSRPAPGIFSFIYNNRPDMCAPVARLLFFFLRLLLPSLVFFFVSLWRRVMASTTIATAAAATAALSLSPFDPLRSSGLLKGKRRAHLRKEEEEMLNLLPPTWFPSSCPAACISNDPSSWFGCIASIASVFSID